MAAPPSLKSRPMRVTPPRAGAGPLIGRLRPPAAFVGESDEGKAMPCLGADSGEHTAALRLVVWWTMATMGRSPRGFFQDLKVFLPPVFLMQSLFLQNCVPVRLSLRGVSIKGAALRVLRTFYKPSLHIMVMPVAPFFQATAREKRGEKKVLPRP